MLELHVDVAQSYRQARVFLHARWWTEGMPFDGTVVTRGPDANGVKD